ncbi:MAG: glycosyltransferase [Opitutaceae bacterium]|nr:glycosyltransferase [Opitutaceae bacterium]
MIWVYRLLFLPALLVLAPYYLWRMRRRGGYGAGFMQRFGADPGLPPKTPGRPRVWLQAVSVGEMLAIAPILEALRRDGADVYLTTTTSTGHALARERYAGLVAGMGYFPLDAWPCVARAWRRVAPDLVILAEGERWPEHLHAAAARAVPVLNINARLSDRSFARLRKFPRAAALTFRGVTRLLAVSADDAERFITCGMPRGRVTVSGNIKLDVTIPRLGEDERARLRRELGLRDGDLVLLGSSTWPGEEAALVAAMREARSAGLRCSLLIVPRHAERRAAIEAELAATGLRHHFRSRGAAAGEVDVAVADTTGELRRLAQLGDVVFVGKSLPPHTEGQTPVEAAALGKPILFGAGMGNFRVIARDLLARGAAREVADAAALAAAARALLADPAARVELAAAAARWHGDNAGAAARTAAEINAALTRLR